MRLISRWQNSAGERVRIALNLKGHAYGYVPRRSLGEAEFKRLNPQGLLPVLDVGGHVIAQSGAILEYLEERYPDPPLLPVDLIARAQSRSFAAHINSEMHAITIARVRGVLERDLAVGKTGLERWLAHWMGQGFTALEATLAVRERSAFCFGETPGWADLHLVPQLANARRFGIALDGYPRLLAVDAACAALDAFIRARPESQIDYPGG